MNTFIEALQNRFQSDTTLRKLARRMHFGLGAAALKSAPFVDVIITGTNDEDDTFDSDIERVALTFNIVTKDHLGETAMRIVAAMRRVFDDAQFSTGDYVSVEMHLVDVAGPLLEPDRDMDAQLRYEAILVRVVNAPLVRSA
jgi:hypothetical protein